MEKTDVDYLKEAELLADYLIDITSNSKLPLEYTNFINGENYGNVMVDDLGDYAPFMSWLGSIKNKKYAKWAEERARFTIAYFQMPNGLICTSFRRTKAAQAVPKKGNNKVFNADKMSDAVLGINLMYDLTKERRYKDSARLFFLGLKKHMATKEGFIYYKKNPLFVYPFSTGKYCGLYIEELIKLYEATKEKELMGFAKKLAYAWINEPFFEKHGLFPFKCTSKAVKPFAKVLFKRMTSFSFETSMLSKSNTNIIFGLVRLYKITKDPKIEWALERWVKAVDEKLMRKEKILLSLWAENNRYGVTYLGADHAAIDSLLEIYLATSNKKALELAKVVANGWLRHQSGIGLIPETPFSYDTSKISGLMKNYSMARKNISRLDSQTDFAIVLLKMNEITGEKSYLESAKKIAKGIVSYHKLNRSYAEFVDIANKKRIGHVIETKFLFLLLKLFVLMHEIGEHKKIYKHSLIRDIIRDR